MKFEASNEELKEDIVSPDDLLTEDGTYPEEIDLLSDTPMVEVEEEIVPELDEYEKKDRARQVAKRSLKVRRAIEDFFEEKKIRHELDYLFADGSKKKKK